MNAGFASSSSSSSSSLSSSSSSSSYPHHQSSPSMLSLPPTAGGDEGEGSKRMMVIKNPPPKRSKKHHKSNPDTIDLTEDDDVNVTSSSSSSHNSPSPPRSFPSSSSSSSFSSSSHSSIDLTSDDDLSSDSTSSPKNGFRIERNVKGVPGFHVVYNCFSEEIEERLFELSNDIAINPKQPNERKGKSMTHDPEMFSTTNSFPDDIHRIVNCIKDSGLHPNLVTPNYFLNLLYTPGASFNSHRDSPKRWGLSIVGVCLGQGAIMKMSRLTDAHCKNIRQCSTDKSVEVALPRRCIYIMLDESRNAWKHGILKQTAGHMKNHPNLYDTQHPVWNPQGRRSSLTLRSTRLYCQVMLDLQHPKNHRSKEMKQRIKKMSSYKPSGYQTGGSRTWKTGEEISSKISDYSVKKKNEETSRLMNNCGNYVLPFLNQSPWNLRFSRDDVNF